MKVHLVLVGGDSTHTSTCSQSMVHMKYVHVCVCFTIKISYQNRAIKYSFYSPVVEKILSFSVIICAWGLGKGRKRREKGG